MNDVTSEYQRLVVENRYLVDVRAPVEFKAGSLPTAVNLPLLDDQQRHRVGVCYKEQGNLEAVDLGHRLVSGVLKKNRIETWLDCIRKEPQSVLFCFRGGQRSQFVQQWLKEESGTVVPRLEGGYKEMRRYLLDQLEPSSLQSKTILVGGKTGAGKTTLLKRFASFIDLEGLANHRGSTFGRFLTPQPGQVDFENSLAWKLTQHRHHGYACLLLEDEGKHVGRCYIPNSLADHFSLGGLVLLEASLDERIERIWQEYVLQDQGEHISLYGWEKGMSIWFQVMMDNLGRIKKRLGGERLKRVKETLTQAQQQQLSSGKQDGHRSWIAVLIREYYDPMYEYQVEKRGSKVMFKGEAEEVEEFLEQLSRRK